jgi:putative ABC transport system permease protein
MDTILQDVRLTLRRLFRNKTYSALIILSLALGIGVNTAIFSMVNTLLLRPLTVEDVDSVVFSLDMRTEDDPFESSMLSVLAFRSSAGSFSSVGMARYVTFSMRGRERPERIRGAAISSDYLTTLGIKASKGRIFTPDDDRPEAQPVALLSHSAWQIFFGGDPGIIDGTVSLDDRLYTVVGILPPGFDLPQESRIWVPLGFNPETLPLAQQAMHNTLLVARLKPGVSLQQANVEAGELARRLEQDYPEHRKGWGIKLIPLRQQLMGDLDGKIRSTLYLLMAIVGFLLLITCANVASLLLGRSVERSHEIAVQVALGASQRRLIGQSLTESILLSLIGGGVGLLLAQFVTSTLMALRPIHFIALRDVFQEIPIDGRVLGFAFLVSLLTGVLFAMVPAARVAIPGSLISSLTEGGQRSGGGLAGRRLFDALMVGGIAVATILLIGAGLMVRSFQKLNDAELGFRPDNLLTTEMTLSTTDYPQYPQKDEFLRQVLDKVRAIPGVAAAGTTTNVPLSITSADAGYTVEGRPPLHASEAPITAHRLVSPGYLETLGVELIQGRLIEEHDRADSLPVVVISKEFARRAWPGEDPIGKRLKHGNPPSATSPWFTVVGVVDDVKEDRFNFRINRPVWYIPYAQRPNTLGVVLLVRAAGNPAGLAPSVREAVASVNRNQPIAESLTMDERIAEFMGPQRFAALLSGLFAALGLFLASVGTYGVTSYMVTNRRREFCIRMAFGAQWRDLIRLILGRGLRLALVGLVIGSVGGFVLGRLLSSLLYEVNPAAPEMFAGPAVMLLIIVLVALSLPAIRLLRLDPVVGLRHD